LFPHWSAEISYVDTGDAGITNSNPSVAATLSDASISYKIPTVSGSYHLFGPTRKVDVFGRVGLSSIYNSVTDDRIPYEKQTVVQLNVGGGVQWRFAPKWFLRAEYDSFDNDASYIGISIGRYFAPHDEHRMVEEVVAQPEPVIEEPIVEEPIIEEPEVVEVIVPAEVCETFNGTIDDVRFEIDSAVILDSSFPVLNEVAQNLALYPEVIIGIQAHSDSTGTDSYNLDLSNRRALSIKAFFVERGISADRLSVEGYGESLPKATNSTREGRALNRRVEFKTIDTQECE
jgi:outer membrane protein OmpA-like peptidoglycan-associated protein